MSQKKSISQRRAMRRFGDYLRSTRENRTSFGQAEAAGLLGISRQALNSYEQGTRQPPESVLVDMARLYRVPTVDVLERAYWPQLVLLPLMAIVDPDLLSRQFVAELEKGLKKVERRDITRRIEELLQRRHAVVQ